MTMKDHRVLLNVSLMVFAVHWGLILWLSVTSETPIRILPVEKLAVQTIQLQPQVTVAETESKSESEQKPEPEPEPEPPKPEPPKPKPAPPKPAPSKPKPKPNPKPKPTPEPKKTPSQKPKIDPALLSKAQQSLAKVRQGGSKSSGGGTPNVASLQSLSIDTKATQKDLSYRDELAARLRTLLKFPEMGAVEIQLTITKTGSVKNVKVLNTESKENEKYVAKVLPTLQMPTFGNRFGSAAEHTFAITLSNE